MVSRDDEMRPLPDAVTLHRKTRELQLSYPCEPEGFSAETGEKANICGLKVGKFTMALEKNQSRLNEVKGRLGDSMTVYVEAPVRAYPSDLKEDPADDMQRKMENAQLTLPDIRAHTTYVGEKRKVILHDLATGVVAA